MHWILAQLNFTVKKIYIWGSGWDRHVYHTDLLTELELVNDT